MKIFRAKQLVSTSAGFVYEGQLFLVVDAVRLPLPKSTGDVASLINDHYDEIKTKSAWFKLDSYIKLERPL